MSPRVASRPASGYTLVELLIVIGIIGVIGAMAVPPIMYARRSSMEAAVVASLRAIASAQRVYSITCADGAYATALSQLGRPPLRGGAPFISPDMAVADTVVKSGYAFRVARGTDGDSGVEPACNGVAAADLATSFYAVAVPVNDGSSSARHYWLGAHGGIFVHRLPITDTDGFSVAPGGVPVGTQGPVAAPAGRPGGGALPDPPGRP